MRLKIIALIIAASTAVGVTPLNGAEVQSKTAGATKAISQALEDAKGIEWQTGYVTEAVNVRAEPSVDSEDVGTLYLNDKVKYYECSAKWRAVIYQDEIRYIYHKYISDKKIVVETADVTQATGSSYEVELLAHLIFAEANTLGYTGMKYAGSVALNRVASSKYPNTLEGVIYQRGQYQCTSNGAINKQPTQAAYTAAKELIEGGSVLPSYVVYQAEFPQGKGIYTTLGNTYYCY